MSEFVNSSSMAVPDSFGMYPRVTEVQTEGNALSGDMRWRWTSSANHYWQPKQSYVVLKLSITKSAGAAITAADTTILSADPGATLWSTCGHTINGQQVGLTSNPPQDSILLKRLFMSKEVRDSLGGGLFSLSEKGFTGNIVNIIWQPPLGLWNVNQSVGGQCQHVLSATLHNDLAHRIVAQSSLARSSISVSVVSAKLMVAHIMPVSVIKPPKTLVIPMLNLNTNSQTVNSNGSSTMTFTVPPSTRRIVVSSQLSDLRLDAARGPTFLGGTPLDNLFVDYAGMQSPSLPYVGVEDTLRKYADLYSSSLLHGNSVYDTQEQFAAQPITGHLFSKSPEDISTTATVRFTAATGAANPSNVFCTALSYSTIVLQHDSSGVTTGVNYLAVN